MSHAEFNQSVNGTATLADVRRLAYTLHQGQKDHSGKDYILHPERVVNNLIRFFPDATEHEIMAAWLHDTMEDCYVDGKKVDAEYLLSQGVPQVVVTMVELLTKPEDDEREYEEVIDDLIESCNDGAIKIKISDNGDNLHPVRVAELFRSQMERDNPGKAERLKNRYMNSIEKLSHTLGINPSRIFTLINNPEPLKQEFVL
ncbi:MAG TPA: hypothetical protein PLF01_02145 [Alphaproteobacteria bacterium]|nr:hypothetical protein [Alphaproteobacteria bacterium]